MALELNLKLRLVSILVLGIWACQATSHILPGASMAERHEQWMARYGRVYKDDGEKERRLKIFKANADFIESFNSDGSRPYKLAINEFADLTSEEFRASRNGYKKSTHPKPSRTAVFRYENVTAVPSSMDWRKKGAVTAIKDQGQCGKANTTHRQPLFLMYY